MKSLREMRTLSKKPSGQPFSVSSSMMILRPSRWMDTVPQGSSNSFGSLTASELPLLKIFVFMDDVYTDLDIQSSGEFASLVFLLLLGLGAS
jgi:hypothetical protein